MNRVILIGNGFDLAHGLKTSYTDFIDDFWEKKLDTFIETLRKKNILGVMPKNSKISQTAEGIYKYNDNDIRFDFNDTYSNTSTDNIFDNYSGYKEFINVITQFGLIKTRNDIQFYNTFLGTISYKNKLQNWVDIEEEYYLALIKCLEDKTENEINNLNKDFFSIQTYLGEYLKNQSTTTKIMKSSEIEKKISEIKFDRNSFKITGKQTPENFLFLNFNYTNTEKLYVSPENKVIHIHGELDNPKNPIIFGYGDEIDNKYKLIEEKNDNRYLENVKSIKYSETRNYRELLNFINSDYYQVYIMGHSCGISDRTLLNTLFENDNCALIKIFYHKREDKTDNYSDIVRNISRNFTKKSLMRERLIPKENSEPLS
jgi:hypothetical protein